MVLEVAVLDTSTPSTGSVATQATALVTRASATHLEVRVWPPEEVWTVARVLGEAGHDWESALPDECGLPSSLLLRRDRGFSDADVERVVSDLGRPGTAVLGYLGADDAGTCARVPGPATPVRDHVVFVEIQQLPHAGRWQVRAFGAGAALARLRTAARGLALALGPRPDELRSAVLELPGLDGVVGQLVERLDRAGLDGHLRVLREHVA